MGLPAGLGGNICSFSDEESAGHAGALPVEFYTEVGRNVGCIGAVARLGCEDDTVRECRVADLNRLEERGLGSRRHCCRVTGHNLIENVVYTVGASYLAYIPVRDAFMSGQLAFWG